MIFTTPTILVIHISIYFLILFTGYSAYQNIITKIHQDQGDRSLGPFEMSCQYLAMIVSNMIAPAFYQKISPKTMITFTSLGYTFHYGLGFFMKDTSDSVKYILAGVGALVNGFCSGILWVGVGSYIHRVCHRYKVIDKKGYFYGLFSTIYTCNTVIGAIILTFGLQLMSEYTYFLITSLITIFSFFYALVFIKDIKEQQQQQLPHNNTSQTEPEIKQALNNDSSSLITQNHNQNTSKYNLKDNILRMKQFYIKMKYSLGIIFIDGINIGVSSSFMLHLLPKTTDKRQDLLNAGYCEIAFGFGCIVGGFLGGKICDIIRVKKSSVISVAIYALTCVLSLLASLYQSLAFAMCCCFLWGFILYFLEAVQMVMCSRIYEGKPQSFAIVKQFHCFSIIIFFVIGIVTHNNLPVYYVMLALLILAVPAVYGAIKMPQQEKNSI